MNQQVIFKTASKEQQKLKVTISGQSGSGKTMGALRLARGLTSSWDKVFFIDTERSANKYSDIGAFRVVDMLPPFHPDRCNHYIKAAIDAGAEVVVFDSASAEWDGPGGCLEIMDEMKQSNMRDSFSGWAKVGKMHKRFVEDILRCPAHFITTVRTKTEWVIEKDEKGKSTPRKLGLKEIQREGWEYEFDIALTISRGHYAECDKDRTNTISDEAPFQISVALGEKLKSWAMTGSLTPIAARDDDLGKQTTPSTPPTNGEIKALVELSRLKNWKPSEITEINHVAFGIRSANELSREQYNQLKTIVTDFTYEGAVKRLIEENTKKATVLEKDNG